MQVILQVDLRQKQNHKKVILPAHRQNPYLLGIGERPWTDVESGKQSPSDYPVSKKLIHLLRHRSLPRNNDGAIGFSIIVYCHHRSDEKWKNSMAGGGGQKKRFQYCSDSTGTLLYPRALQGHSGRSLIDPSLQDNVIIPDGFFKYIYHDGCAINLHSIINSGMLPGGQNLSNRQTVFFLPVNPTDKEHKDPGTTDFCTIHAQSIEETSKYGVLVNINLALKRGLKFYQTRSHAIILHETLPAHCILRVVRMETGAVTYFKHDWMKDLGSEVARQPEGGLARQNPDHVRTVKPVVCPQRGALHSQKIETCSFRKEAVKHDGTGKPV